MRIKSVSIFKAGTGAILNVGDPVLVHYAIALSHEDIEAANSKESSYAGALPLLARLGDESMMASLVSDNLIGHRSRCTIRLTVEFNVSLGLPETVAVELWPDNLEPDRLPVERFELVRTFPVRDMPSETATNDEQVESDSLWIRRLLSSPIATQTSGIVVCLSEAAKLRLASLLKTPNGSQALVLPPPLSGTDQYLLHAEIINFLNRRYL